MSKKIYKVKIIGAGSIGNHLSYACRQKNWDVFLCDTDPAALERTKNKIYPDRHGSWDEKIHRSDCEKLRYDYFDLVIIGTPPSSHLELAIDHLTSSRPPSVLLIEKPLSIPNDPLMKEFLMLRQTTQTRILVGYNHNITANTQAVDRLLQYQDIGKIQTIHAEFRENINYILNAHPWIEDIRDSYLCYSKDGGGSFSEHSHAAAIWLHFSKLLKLGPITEVNATAAINTDRGVSYDQVMEVTVKTATGVTGKITTDFLSQPAIKRLEIIGEKGKIIWSVNAEPNIDRVEVYGATDLIEILDIPKTRPDDFKPEIDAIESLLDGNISEIPALSLENGIEAMQLLEAAHLAATSR